MRFLVIAALSVSLSVFAETVSLSATQFLERVVAGEISATTGKRATIYFEPGSRARVPYSLQRLMIHLASQGVAVDGALVDEDAYLKAIDDSSKASVMYELQGFEDRSLPKPRGAPGELLGVPRGVSPISINPVKPLKDFSARERGIFFESAAIHSLVLLTGLQMANNLTLVPAAVLTTYFYQVFANFKAILDFKGQGAIVVRDGDALKVDVNPYFLALMNVAEEIAINGAVGATIPSEGGLSIQSTLSTSLAFGLAKTSVDRYAAQMEKQAKLAEKEGDTKLADSIRRQQLLVMRLFFNGVVPVMRTLAMLTEKTEAGPLCSAIKGGVTALTGCHAIYSELKRMGRLRFLPKKYRGKSCAQALVVFHEE